MRGQRGTVGSLPETFFDHGSTSNNAAIDQQVCWNNIRTPIENRLPDCLLSPNDMNTGCLNSIGREEQELGRWSLGEPSSSGTQNEVSHNEWKTDHEWSSSMSASANASPSLEERQYEQNSLFVESSNSETVPQNLCLNASLVGHGDNNCQVTERSNLYKSSGSENEQSSPAAGPEAFLLSSGSGGYVVDDNDSRPGCSYEGRRASCKRKALEENVGQSSSSGSSNYFHRAESSAWHGVSASCSTGSSVNVSVLSRQVHPRLGLDVRESASDSIPEPFVLPAAESSHRNFRLRINPSSIQEPIGPPIFSTSDTARQSVLSLQQSSRLLPTDHSLDLRSAPMVDNASPQNPNVVNHVPTLPRNVQTFRWNGGSRSRTGNSSSYNVSADRDAVQHEGHQSRSMGRNLLDHPMFVSAPELRTLARNPTNQGLSSENISTPGNVASTSCAGSSSGANVSSASMWVPHPNPSTQYPRRLSELVRQSLMSSLGAESGGQGNHSSLSSGHPTSSEGLLLSSGVANLGRHHPYPRSMPWLERRDAGLLGIPHAFRTLTAATEGRSRLFVSEIRNVLDLMHRGENLRFEDVMILDQSVFLGIADIPDRYRDMRLDVDNMSYEELLALEERIGNVSTGLSEETILNHLKRRKHSSATRSQLETEPCCVCREEYNDGEDLGTLECGHNFHADCIKQWLMRKNLCPICKAMGLTK
ncbi:probable E3 ubiquitin-protein ligase RHG1A [Durio zibethinus]|uniref:RING-type E3 ubiquitin transferase n=1 Tax=Durio zibethinus TaxID=66656 RepID=A0A6P6B7K8_DURZI|nr:probable E3 ubiquitin-protein ligase RHG1A [Durio zibethinus]XP_022772886.1 probable E3 ubiquitin-protein ligase RHG1A [Durio zibethinus]XP_022772887.1 probable E3 ubiquitin-protein ligase RHG1A [Durio zibethinus]XP_022772888.1 probable E3 ubiquitin-protein ligase RHG1A [Durio zibethinus]